MNKSQLTQIGSGSSPRKNSSHRKFRRLSFIVLAFAVVLGAAAIVASQLTGVLRIAEAARQQGIDRPVSAPTNTQGNKASDPVSVEPLNGGEADSPLSARQTSGPISVLVELTDTPTTEVYADSLSKSTLPRTEAEGVANRAAQAQLRVIQQAQQTLSSTLQNTFKASEIYRVQRVLNGIAVTVDASRLEALRQTPGVKAVHILVPEEISNSTSVPFLGVQQLWDNSLGIKPDLTGRHIKIGIIDTGIDYIHANFGGTGLAADYNANDRTTNADGYFPTAKVVGGKDFAGDRYNASAASTADPADTAVPAPDADPMDCNSHGSHVAGTAAGLGVKTDGTTFTGPYGTTTPFSSLRIGPGTAPGADLYALRVFGCVGSTLLTTPAIEWSVDPNADGNLSDRLDVINMSLGSGYGTGFDASAVSATNAAKAGVIVVAAAGNSGDSYFITGSPGTSSRTLSVAASVDPGAGTGASLKVNAPPSIAGDKPAATVAYGPAPNGQTADVVLAQDATAASGGGTLTDACEPLTNAAQMAGKIAIADRGLCTIKTKTLNAQNAGAIGVIIVNNVATDIAPPGFADDATITTPILIPTLSILLQDGNGIKAELASANTVNVTFRSGDPSDTIASFSSHGPRRGELPLLLKPDISGPGLNITSSFSGIVQSGGTAGNVVVQPGSQALTISGTSMATPHLAGIMALLRQLHPDWSVEELKASAMNGAIHDIFVGANNTGPRYGLSRIGAGRVDPQASAINNSVAYDADQAGVVSVSSFENEVVGSATRARTIRVVNKGATDQTYTLGIDTVNDSPGVAFSLPGGTSLLVPAGQTRTFNVQMSATADLMDHVRDPTVASAQGNARHYLSEEGAYITFRQGSQLQMRVPVYATPRPASNMHSTDVVITGGATSGQTALALNGQDVCTGTRSPADCTGAFPTDVVSLVTPFELQVNDPVDPGVIPSGDLRYAGVSYDGSFLLFGVSTYGDWTWPRDTEFDIYIDANEDGVFERVLFNTQTTVGGFGTDAYVSALFNTSTGATTLASFINGVSAATRETAIFNTNVMFLPVGASSILATGDTSFRYAIRVFNANGGIDEVGFGTVGTPNGPRTFNYAAPGVSFPPNFSSPNNSGILFADLDTRTIPVNFNRTNLTANGSLGALLLHHNNARGSRAEIVTVQGATTTATDIGVGLAVNNPSPPLNSNVTFTVVATNNGPITATNLQVSDKLPPGLLFVSASASTGSYVPATGVWTIGSLASGASATLTIVATVQTTDQVTDTVVVAGADQLDSNPANDQASVTLQAPRSADLAVTLSANTAIPKQGDTLTFTATVTNAGEDPANNIVVNISFAPPQTITSSSPSSGVFNHVTGVWNIASLGKQAFATLTFTIVVPRICGSILATANVSADTADPNTINNTAATSVQVGPITTVQFSASTYPVQEDSTAVNVTVNRTGDTSIPLTVNYTTANGTASSRSDYETAAGTLSFAGGETSKIIPVLINEDSFVEGTESFTITLSNTSTTPNCEVGLGSPITATIQITDDATEPATNPIDDTTLFVRQHYHDFLNREPDAPGLAFWVNNIDSCGADATCRSIKRVDTSAAFFLSIEFQDTGYFVYRSFTAAFGTTRIGGKVPLTFEEFLPDTQQVGRDVIIGQAGADAKLEANKQAYMLQFVQRPAFASLLALSPSTYVDTLNTNTGNSLTTAQRDALVAQLTANNTTQGRADVLRAVVDNAAFKQREFNRAFVLMQYFGYLRRNPNDSPDSSYAGYDFWLNKLNSFNGDFRKADMVKSFIVSGEYRSRFGN